MDNPWYNVSKNIEKLQSSVIIDRVKLLILHMRKMKPRKVGGRAGTNIWDA